MNLPSFLQEGSTRVKLYFLLFLLNILCWAPSTLLYSCKSMHVCGVARAAAAGRLPGCEPRWCGAEWASFGARRTAARPFCGRYGPGQAWHLSVDGPAGSGRAAEHGQDTTDPGTGCSATHELHCQHTPLEGAPEPSFTKALSPSESDITLVLSSFGNF